MENLLENFAALSKTEFMLLCLGLLVAILVHGLHTYGKAILKMQKDQERMAQQLGLNTDVIFSAVQNIEKAVMEQLHTDKQHPSPLDKDN